MVTDIVIAGLSVAGFDALRELSELQIAPSGKLFASPVKRPGYFIKQAQEYQEKMRDRILALLETTRVSITLAYVDYSDETTAEFIDRFRPFALVRPISPFIEQIESAQARNISVRRYCDYLIAEAKELRSRARKISEFTQVHNVTPYLLPCRNFDSHHFSNMIGRLYDNLGIVADIAGLMKAEAKKLAQHHPRVTPPGQQDSCYSDGLLYFRSPGRQRHGYFRHDAGRTHHPSCLLAARSRLGGAYAHDLHYD